MIVLIMIMIVLNIMIMIMIVIDILNNDNRDEDINRCQTTLWQTMIPQSKVVLNILIIKIVIIFNNKKRLSLTS